jgi:hypothetical protein
MKTAQAQSGMNRDTAISQQQINMVNQNNPWGTVGYEQTGASGFRDSQGNWVETPTYTQTTTFSPQQQAIFDQTQQAQGNLAGIANQQSDFLRSYLGQGMDTGGLPGLVGDPGLQGSVNLAQSYAGADDFSADRQRVEDALWQRTAGDRAQQDEALRSRLVNSGIREGSAAWNAEMERMGRQNTDARLATILAGGDEQARMVGMARDAAGFGNQAQLAQAGFGNQAALQGAAFQNAARGQGMAELFGLRNQPINEITALMSGSQVSNPAVQGAPMPQAGVGGVDYTGLVNQEYQANLAQHQNMMGGLFGLGSAGIGLFSDRRLKTEIRRVGETDGGTPLYAYRYIWGGPVHIGVMADEVPEAAMMTDSGYLAVDYARVA